MSSQDDNTIVLDLGDSVDTGTSSIDTITLGDITMNNSSYYSPGATVGGISSIDISSLNNYITTGSSTMPYTYATTGTNYGYTFTNTPTTVEINTDGLTMASGTDITVGGKSLTKAIEQIEERLGILHPNPELEDRWEQLKELRKQYMELEKDLLEKEKIMKILKET